MAAGLTIDLDATVTVAHSEKENAAATWKKTYGLRFRAGRPRPGCPGKAGSNTAADHVSVLDMALAALPPRARPRPGDPACAAVLISADAAGATHLFAAAVRERGCPSSLGFAIDEQVQDAVRRVPPRAWTPAHDIDGQPRDGAQVADFTGCANLAAWPEGSPLIIRRERPHPGAQLRFTDISGHRFTAFLTDTRGGQLTGLEVRHRSHARAEDRIRAQKATGLRNLPCRGYEQNKAWLELSLAAADLPT